MRVALAGDDGSDHAQAAGTSHVADHVVELDVHALERLLHVLHVAGRHARVIVAKAYVVLQQTYLR